MGFLLQQATRLPVPWIVRCGAESSCLSSDVVFHTVIRDLLTGELIGIIGILRGYIYIYIFCLLC